MREAEGLDFSIRNVQVRKSCFTIEDHQLFALSKNKKEKGRCYNEIHAMVVYLQNLCT